MDPLVNPKPNRPLPSSASVNRKQRVPASNDNGARPGVVLAIAAVGLVTVAVLLFHGIKPSEGAPVPPEATQANAERSNRPFTSSLAAQPPQPTQPAHPLPQPLKPTRPLQPPSGSAESMEERWGITITGMRIAMGGNGLDLRYKVLDSAKATNLLHMQDGTFVIDQNSGESIPVPFQRENQTSQKLVTGKTYFALLSNKGQVVKPGNKVTVAIGNSRTQDVTVQ